MLAEWKKRLIEASSRPRKAPRGMTLIEIMVVLVILGLIASFIGCIDGGSRRGAVLRPPLGQYGDELLPLDQVGRKFGQPGSACGHAGSPIGVAAQRRNSLGKHIDILKTALGQLVEEQMKLIKLQALDIPVSLLGLAVQVKGIGKLLVEQRHHRLPRAVGNVVAAVKLL